MAIRTSSITARSSSHSTQSAPKKSSSAQRSGSASRSSAPTQSKQTSSAPKRDTFTRSTPTAKQTPSKTSATSTAKTSTASKSSQAKTSTAKSNTTVKTSSSKTVTKAKSNPTASKAKRDSFEFSSEAVKKSVQSAKSSKSSANSKATTKSSTKNSANAQTKKTVKSNSSSKGTKGSSKGKTKSAQSKIPEGLKQHLQHTNDPKQKAGMRKTAEDYAAGKVVDQVSQKLKEFGIDLSALHTATTDTGTVFKLTKAKAYSIVPDGDKLAETGQYLTESDFQRIVNIMTHEAGSTQNANSEMFGIASVVLNEYEHIGFYDSGNYSKDTFTEFLDGFYELNSNLSTGGGMNIASGITSADTTWKQAEDILQYTLQGNRAFGSETCYWVGNSSGKYAGRVIGFSTQERGVVDTSGGVKGIDY